MDSKSVCIIGGGVAGLAATKECLQSGYTPTCYEKGDDIGGIWNFKETASDGDPSLYASCVLNTSKTMTAFSDFPFPKESPNFPHHSVFKKYLKMYAEHFELMDKIKLRHKVLEVRKTNDFQETGQWNVMVENLSTGSTFSLVYDYVLVCNGHFYDPFIPELKGLDTFKGEVIHSHSYKDFRGFEGKNVLIVGLGNSAGDVASELSRHANHVFLSTRHGAYTISRGLDHGLPFDWTVLRRLTDAIPEFIKGPIAFHKLNARANHSGYGLAPNHPYNNHDLIVNDELPTRILVGSLSMKPDVEELTTDHVRFEDGSEECVDAIVFCTGYEYGFPFLEDSAVPIVKRFPFLYKQILPLDMEQNTLYIIGLASAFGPVVPLIEMQARWAVRCMEGHITLPTQKEMKLMCQRRREELEATFGREIRFNLAVPFIETMDHLAADIGCSPRPWRYLVTSPRFWWMILAGPVIPAQYRLEGPGKWAKAREVIENSEKNIWFPMKTRRAGEHETEGLYSGVIELFSALVVAFSVSLAYLWY